MKTGQLQTALALSLLAGACSANEWGSAEMENRPKVEKKSKGPILTPGTEAPDFTLKNVDGQEVTLSQFRGQKFVVLEWASST